VVADDHPGFARLAVGQVAEDGLRGAAHENLLILWKNPHNPKFSGRTLNR
jgi:hypothetical protein